MAQPTLLIGIGTSGLRVLEETQNFYFENTGKNKPGNVQYLYLETDENSQPSTTVLKNEIKRVYLDLSGKETKINNLNQVLSDPEWVPSPEFIMDAGFGAGGLPAFGRVALWGGENFSNVKESIRNAYSEVSSHTQKDSNNNKPAVFIVGSLTGGTGSGVFIDLAYMIKELIVDIVEVYGLFLIPGRDHMGKDSILYCNTLASLNALEHYNDTKNVYEMRWPDGTSCVNNQPPFELSQFISQDYHGDAPPISTLAGLYKIAGLNLFLNIFGLREKRKTRIGDGKASIFIDKYGTFGLSAIQYPKRQLQELLGINLSKQLLERWIDPNAYYAQGNKIQINSTRAEIQNKTMAELEGFLREAFGVLDAVNIADGKKVINDIQVKANEINTNSHGEKLESDYVRKLFTSNNTGNYYDAIKNNIKNAEDVLIERIHNLVTSTVDNYESLVVVRIQLEAVIKGIDKCIDFWKSLQIHPRADKWEVLLEKQINWILKGRFKLIGQQHNIVVDRLNTTLDLMKMHLMADRIKEIKDNIIKGDYALTSFDKKVELPRISRIDEIIKLIRNTIKVEDQNATRYKSLDMRWQSIKRDLEDNTIPILRIYPSGDYKEEFKKSLEKYRRESSKSVPSKKTVIGDASLWNYFNTSLDRLNQVIYSETIKSFEDDVIKYKSIDDLDITDYIEREPLEAKKIAERSTYPLLMINNDKKTEFQEAKGIPKLIIGSNDLQIDKTVSVFKDFNYNDFNNDDDGKWTREEIRNIIIFYNEKGYMSDHTTFSPLQHLRYVNDIKRIYKEQTEHFSRMKGVESKVWHKLRNPYVNYEENTLIHSAGE